MFGNQLVISIFATPKQWRIYPESYGDCSFFNFFLKISKFGIKYPERWVSG